MLRKRGFTLIELLVVIAIIGILSAIILASLSGARPKGRDTKRIADLKELQLALQLYYDANSAGSYPTTAGNVGSVLSALTSADYISVLPIDPTAGHDYYYLPATCTGTSCAACSTSPCTDYILAAQLENDASNLNGYQEATPSFVINGATNNCSQTGGPSNFIYCVRP